MQASDYVLIGSGINSLVCAAVLARKGASVTMLERNPGFGGCIRSEALTVPGYLHDVLASWYPGFLASGGYAAIGSGLHRHGLEFCNTDRPAAVVLPDGRHFVLRRERAANVQAMNDCCAGDGDRYLAMLEDFERTLDLTLGVLASDLSLPGALRVITRALVRHGWPGVMAFAADNFQSARALLETEFSSDLVRAFLAPWALHAGLGPDAAGSAQMMRLLPFSLELAGMPLVRGGGGKLVDAFAALISEHGGSMHANTHVSRIEVQARRARGVHSADGRFFAAKRAVICNVAPAQLYGELLPREFVPEAVGAAARRFRRSRACMQIHVAMREPARWLVPDLDDVAYIHVTDSLESISRAVNEADRGLLPATATIAVGQPAQLDASRVPPGAGILWIQLLELPARIRGDAAGQINAPPDGLWSEGIREAYADRILGRLARYVTNLDTALIARKVVSPADLEAMNINLVGGDPFGGDRSLDQSLFGRPMRDSGAWRTPVANVYQIGASTHPGHNLGAGSGFALARRL